MRNVTWLALLLAILTLTPGCEKEKPAAPAPESRSQEPAPAAAERAREAEAPAQAMAEPAPPAAGGEEAASAEEKAGLVNINEKIAAEVAQPEVMVPPETVTYEASMGTVTFDHAMHAGSLACGSCHETDPPRKIAVDKDFGHTICKGCHEDEGAGPTGCKDCHQK